MRKTLSTGILNPKTFYSKKYSKTRILTILDIKLLILALQDLLGAQGQRLIVGHKNIWHLKLLAIHIMESPSIYGPSEYSFTSCFLPNTPLKVMIWKLRSIGGVIILISVSKRLLQKNKSSKTSIWRWKIFSKRYLLWILKRECNFQIWKTILYSANSLISLKTPITFTKTMRKNRST